MKQFRQSPINVVTEQTEFKEKVVDFHYHKEVFEVSDNGLNISLTPTTNNNYIGLKRNNVHLTEIHFHKPGEHQIDSELFDMEVHLVHQENSFTIVYGVLLKFSDFGYDFGKPFSNIGNTIEIDLNKLITSDKCWQYYGSFTTTPFAEQVIWLINKQTLEVNQAEGEILSSYYPCNNRCIQPVNDRVVFDVLVSAVNE